MKKYDLIRKLTSRKFWMAIIGLIISLMNMFKVNPETQTYAISVLGSLALCVSYIVAEGFTDGKNVPIKKEEVENYDLIYPDEKEDK